MASRKGLGRTKHLQVQYLWIQDLATKKIIKIDKIPTEWNRSDLLTKNLAAPRMEMLLKAMGFEFREVESKEKTSTRASSESKL